jgi:hypothetical protein
MDGITRKDLLTVTYTVYFGGGVKVFIANEHGTAKDDMLLILKSVGAVDRIEVNF